MGALSPLRGLIPLNGAVVADDTPIATLLNTARAFSSASLLQGWLPHPTYITTDTGISEIRSTENASAKFEQGTGANQPPATDDLYSVPTSSQSMQMNATARNEIIDLDDVSVVSFLRATDTNDTTSAVISLFIDNSNYFFHGFFISGAGSTFTQDSNLRVTGSSAADNVIGASIRNYSQLSRFLRNAAVQQRIDGTVYTGGGGAGDNPVEAFNAGYLFTWTGAAGFFGDSTRRWYASFVYDGNLNNTDHDSLIAAFNTYSGETFV